MVDHAGRLPYFTYPYWYGLLSLSGLVFKEEPMTLVSSLFQRPRFYMSPESLLKPGSSS